MRIAALLLAGGESRRMGQDKRFFIYHGKSLIEKAYESVRFIADEILVLIAKSEDQNKLEKIFGEDAQFLIDQNPHAGPMGALMGGLQAVRSDYALLLAVDYPLLTGEFLVKMRDDLIDRRSHPKALVPVDQDKPQLTCAFYHKALCNELKREFENGERALWRWIEKHPDGIEFISPKEWQGWGHSKIFLNLNRPQDYQSLIGDIESGRVIPDNSQ